MLLMIKLQAVQSNSRPWTDLLYARMRLQNAKFASPGQEDRPLR